MKLDVGYGHVLTQKKTTHKWWGISDLSKPILLQPPGSFPNHPILQPPCLRVLMAGVVPDCHALHNVSNQRPQLLVLRQQQ